MKKLNLIESGKKKIEWVKQHMNVLNTLKEMYLEEQPFKGINISMSIH
ncbi:adenosylhomocysteinase, partial [Marinitoga arctica]